MVARMKLGKELQDKLAEVLEAEGHKAFKNELLRATRGEMKRGIPKGVYIMLRTTFDKRYNELQTKKCEGGLFNDP